MKEIVANIVVVDDAQKRLEERGVGSWLNADIAVDTVEFLTDQDDIAVAKSSCAVAAVSAGTAVSLSYPMQEIEHEGKAVFVMQRRFVDPQTAEIGASWLIVFTVDGEVAHATNYRF